MASKLEYLKQNYLGSGGRGERDAETKKKPRLTKGKTKKKKRKTHASREGVKVYDEDAMDDVGNGETHATAEDFEVEERKTREEEEEEERPVIVTDAHYMARSKREDEKKNSSAEGGWVTVVAGKDDEEKEPSKKIKKKKRHDSDSDEEEEKDAGKIVAAKEPKKKKKKKKRRLRHDSDDDEEEEKEEKSEEPNSKHTATMTTTATTTTCTTTNTTEVEYDSDGDIIVRKVDKKLDGNIDREEETKQIEYDSDGDIITKPPPKTTKNKTGLVPASEIVKEAELRRKEQEERINNMSAETSGKNAKTLVRDKTTGRLLTQEEIEERTKGAQEPKKEREKPVWGGGLKQQQIEKEKEEELRKASGAPFARSEVDAQWNSEKMNEVRYGDPMAKKAYEKQQKEIEKQQKRLNVMEGVDKKLAKKHGFKVPQEVPKHSWRNKAVAVERNRYGIEPGRHWDGVDRGTGFEKKWLQKSELRKHREVEKRGTRNLTDTVYDEDDFNEDLGT